MFFEVVFVDLDVLENLCAGSERPFAFDVVGSIGIIFCVHLCKPGCFGREFVIEGLMDAHFIIEFGDFGVDVIFPGGFVGCGVS